MKMKTGRTYQLVAQRWQSPSGLFHIKRESCIAGSFTQRISSCSSVTCQAWGNFFAQSSSLFFTAPLWALLWWPVPSPLSLDLYRVRLGSDVVSGGSGVPPSCSGTAAWRGDAFCFFFPREEAGPSHRLLGVLSAVYLLCNI